MARRRSSKSRCNRLKRKVETDRTLNTNVGRNRNYVSTIFTTPKAAGKVGPTKCPKAITNPGPHFRFGAAAAPKKNAKIKFYRKSVSPDKVEDYWPIFSGRGEYYAYLYDFNIYSADGSAWLCYFRWAYHWAGWTFYAMDNFPEGVINHYNRAGASSGPHRRYHLLVQPSQPVRPPVPAIRPSVPQMPRYLDPENIWDLEFFMGRRVGPGDMCYDPAEPAERRKDFVPTRLHARGSFGGGDTP